MRLSTSAQFKQMRERAKLTQREVADALGYTTPQFVSNVERGRCRFPVIQLPILAKLYRVPVNTLIEFEVARTEQLLSKAFKIKPKGKI